MPVAEGNTVQVAYEGSFEDGTVFDSSEKHGKPLEFTVGQKQVVPGFEQAVVGMEKGESKEITLKPADAYGEPREDLVKKFPKEQFPQDQDPKVGMKIAVGLQNGQQIPATITKVEDDGVTLDMNHPLAGKTLKFKMTIESYA